MKRRYVVVGLGLLAAVALTSSALGGPSLNSLIKKEVAKQLSVAQVSKKKGKRGPPGPRGRLARMEPTGRMGRPGPTPSLTISSAAAVLRSRVASTGRRGSAVSRKPRPLRVSTA